MEANDEEEGGDHDNDNDNEDYRSNELRVTDGQQWRQP